MSPERVRVVLERDPFLPFRICLKSGGGFRITLPEQVQGGPDLRWLWVVSESHAPTRLPLDAIDDIIETRSTTDFEVPARNAARMSIEKFDEFLTRRPFEPFTVHTADGKSFPVKGPELASRTAGGRTIFVSTGGERTEWIDLLLVTRLTSGIERNGHARSSRRRHR